MGSTRRLASVSLALASSRARVAASTFAANASCHAMSILPDFVRGI